MKPLAEFSGRDGAQHRIYLIPTGATGRLLVDLWEGQGLRLLCTLSTRDEEMLNHSRRRTGKTFASSVAEQAEAVIREYRIEASLAAEPLSRRLELDVTQTC